MNDITRILSSIEQGDPQAAEELLPLVYHELRKLATQRMAQEKPGQTLQATALVHEAFMKLAGNDQEQIWNSRGHFFAAAAEAMRRILIDNARRKQREKHGGDGQRMPLDESLALSETPLQELLELNEALTNLAEEDPNKAELVKLRYFAGLTLEQAAQTMDISLATAKRYWSYSRAWLYDALRDQDEPAS